MGCEGALVLGPVQGAEERMMLGQERMEGRNSKRRAQTGLEWTMSAAWDTRF